MKVKGESMDADAMRLQPLGRDDKGNSYWYFYGTRLYKQEPAKEEVKKEWKEEWTYQKDLSFNKKGRGPRKCKQRKSDEESDESEDIGRNSNHMNVDEKSAWSIVCNTIEDWVDFAEKLKGSKSKNEKSLFQTVTDDFLPVLIEIYQEKERRLQQKLRELVPERVITRRETRKSRVPEKKKPVIPDDFQPIAARLFMEFKERLIAEYTDNMYRSVRDYAERVHQYYKAEMERVIAAIMEKEAAAAIQREQIRSQFWGEEKQ